VPYGYILVSAVFSISKILSDTFVFWGMWQVLFRFEHLDPRFECLKDPALKPGKKYTSPRYFVSNIIAIWLLFFTIYHICLLFGLTFAWLQAADPQVIQLIAKARNAFEIVYMVLQFVGTLGMFLWFIEVVFPNGYTHYYDAYKVRLDPTTSQALVYRIPAQVADAVPHRSHLCWPLLL
jgi:hypothetical protein